MIDGVSFTGCWMEQNSLKSAFSKYASGKLKEAEIEFSAILEEMPFCYDAALGLGLVAIRCGDYEKATEYLTLALKGHSRVARIYLLLAFALAKQGKIDIAKEWFTSAIEIDPNDEHIPRVKSAILLEEGKIDEAEKLILQYLPSHLDESWDMWNDIGRISYANEDYERAMECFLKAIESAEKMGLAVACVYHNLGLCYNAIGDYINARKFFNYSLQIDSSFAPSCCAIGLIEASEGEYERAEEFILKAIELSPEEPSYWYAMAQVKSEQGDQSSAEHYYQEGYKIFRMLFPTDTPPDGSGGRS